MVQTAITLLAAGSFVFLVWRLITRPFRRIMQQLQELEHTGFPLADANSSKDMDFLHRAFVQLGEELQSTLEQAYYSKSIPIFCTTASITYTAWQKWRTPRAWRK